MPGEKFSHPLMPGDVTLRGQPRCTARAKSLGGARCRQPARRGYTVCRLHGAGCSKRVETGQRQDPRKAGRAAAVQSVTTGRYVRASAVLEHFKGPEYQALLDELSRRGAEVDAEIALLRTLVELELQQGDLDDLGVIRRIREMCTAIVRASLVKANLDRRHSVDVDRVLLPMLEEMGRAFSQTLDLTVRDADLRQLLDARLAVAATAALENHLRTG